MITFDKLKKNKIVANSGKAFTPDELIQKLEELNSGFHFFYRFVVYDFYLFTDNPYYEVQFLIVGKNGKYDFPMNSRDFRNIPVESLIKSLNYPEGIDSSDFSNVYIDISGKSKKFVNSPFYITTNSEHLYSDNLHSTNRKEEHYPRVTAWKGTNYYLLFKHKEEKFFNLKNILEIVHIITQYNNVVLRDDYYLVPIKQFEFIFNIE